MIKKILIIVAVLFFAFSVLSLSVLNASAKTTPENLAVIQSPILLPTLAPEVLYYLPYPGILPDHPLYAIKMVRDKIWLWLTTNMQKKAEVELLFADKRLGAGKVLIEGNKVSLGITTIEKAEKYLEQSINQLEEAAKQGKDVKIQVEKIKIASLKHQEVIGRLRESLSGDAKGIAEKILDYPRNVLLRAEKLLP